jgi:serine/threonine protein kinase
VLSENLEVFHKKTKELYSIKVLRNKRVGVRNLESQLKSVLEKIYKLYHANFLRLVTHFKHEENHYMVFQNVNNKGSLCPHNVVHIID